METNNSKLWTKNFTLLTVASAIGSAGGIAGSFALSFFVFDETGSTLASALVIAIQLVPHIFVPLIAAPLMDRLPRKMFLVGGDFGNGVIYIAMGVWLVTREFSYAGYLVVSMVLAMLASVDHLAYASIYPSLIPEGAEQKGYAVSSMLYPVLNVLMAPVGALLLDTLGVPRLLMVQGAMSVIAAVTESFIRTRETHRAESGPYTLSAWTRDIREALAYLKKEKGLRSIFEYMAVSSGVSRGYSPLLVAFFRTAPGLTAAMYSLFSAADFIGRSLGGVTQYRFTVPEKKRHDIMLLLCLGGELLNAVLLWLPYPLMLMNRAAAGFLQNNSGILRSAAVQRYIPEHLRARVNAFNNTLITAVGSVLALTVGALGEIMDYRWCVTFCGGAAMLTCWLLLARDRRQVRQVYEQHSGERAPD